MRSNGNGGHTTATLPSPSVDGANIVSATHMGISDDMRWFGNVLGPTPRGTVMLLSGDPGVGKSTLALQVAASAIEAGERPLYITTEQGSTALMNRLEKLVDSYATFPDIPAPPPFPIVDELRDLAMLSGFLARQVFHPGGRFRGTTMIIVDSLQGQGVAATDKRAWNDLFEFFRMSSAAGITILALAHVTKSNQIAGPRSLEHQVDVVISMRHGITSRALTVSKNRNHASRMDPLLLTMHPESTRLIPSPLSESSTARTKSIGPEGVVEFEAAVTVPRHDRGYVKAPGLSTREVETVADLLQRVVPACRHLESVGITVRAPDGIRQRRDHNLAIALAIVAALTRRELSPDMLLVGDLTLNGEVKGASASSVAQIEDTFAAGMIPASTMLVTGSDNAIESDVFKTIEVVSIHRLTEGVELLLPLAP